MKKNTLLGLLVLGVGSLALASCAKKASAGVMSFEKAYNTSVLSGIGLLSSSLSATAPVNMALVSENTENEEVEAPEAKPETSIDGLTESFKKEIIDNLAIAESTLNGSGIMSEVTKSDMEGYESMYTITKTTITGESKVYTFHYNELTDEDTDELDEEDEKIIEGIVISDDVTYQVRGKKEIEADEEEDEFKIMIDEKNYVIIETEKEAQETEYGYKKYADGKLIYESEVEYEVNKDGEVELSFESEVDGVEVEYSYEFKELNGEKLIDVEIEKEGKEFEAEMKLVKAEDGTVSYEFLSYKESVEDED